MVHFCKEKWTFLDCSMNVAAPKAPFILDNGYNFPTYDGTHSINFKHNETFYVSCPKGTTSSYLSKDGDHVRCLSGTTILNLVTGEEVDFASIKCKSTPVTSVRKLDEKCVNNNSLIEIGFEMNKNFVTMMTVCFDDVKLVPFYCKYSSIVANFGERRSVFSGSDFYRSYVCSENECEFVDSGTMYPYINLDGLYDKQRQILGNLGVVVDKSLLRLPLTTDVLGLTKLESVQQIKVAPFFDYVNVVPAWDAEDSLDFWINLLMTEIMRGDREVLYTGSLGVLSLTNGDDKEVEIFLSNSRVPVPKWIWMVWKFGEDCHQSIVFLYNHPYEHVGTKSGEVCSSYEVLYSSFIISCAFEDVVDPEMKEFITNMK